MSAGLFIVVILIFYMMSKLTSSMPSYVKFLIGLIAFLPWHDSNSSGAVIFRLFCGAVGVLGIFQSFLGGVSGATSEIAEDLGASKEDADAIGNTVARVTGAYIVGQAANSVANTVSDALSNPNGAPNQIVDATNVSNIDLQCSSDNQSFEYADASNSSLTNFNNDTSMMASFFDVTPFSNVPTIYNNPTPSLLGLTSLDIGQQNFSYFDSNGTPIFTVDTNGNVFDNCSCKIGQFKDGSIFGSNSKDFVDPTGTPLFTTVNGSAGTVIIVNNQIVGTVRGGTLYSNDGQRIAETRSGSLYTSTGTPIGHFDAV